MATGAKLAGSWEQAELGNEESATAPVEDAPGYDAEADSPEEPDHVIPSRAQELIPAVALAVLGLSWTALSFWASLDAIAASSRPAVATAQWIALTSAPLALIAVGYLLLGRTSRREARRFVTAARAMRLEAAHLEQTLAAMSDRIDANRRALGDQAHELLLLGDDAGARLGEIATTMARESQALAAQTTKLESASAEARTDLGVLLTDLPKAEAQTRSIGERLREAGLEAHGHASALQAEVAALAGKGRETDEALSAAALRLAAHMAQIESAAETASLRLAATAEEARAALHGVLAQAAETLDEGHKGVAAQNAALLAMVDEARAALDGAGSDAAAALGQRLEAIGQRLEGFGKTLAAQETGTGALLVTMEQKLAALVQRLDALSERSRSELDSIGSRISTVDGDAAALDRTLSGASAHAADLLGSAQSLKATLEQTHGTLAGSLPEVLAQLEAQALRSREAVSAASVDAVKLVTSAAATTTRLGEAEATLQRQQAMLDSLSTAAAEQLGMLEQQAQALETAVDRAGANAERIASGAGPQLVETLVRVREAAAQAAQKARDAIAEAIPDAVRALSHAAGPAASDALHAKVEAQLAAVSAVSERAVQAAHHATERLMRQMLTIADTTASIESRIADAKADLDEQDQDASARRVALLIESLNSISIDVTKILSNDVTDSAWAAYLKGDRGIFTRRAVRLLDHADAREIVRHYEQEPEFREQVNRYVHDFEAMLRRVLAARDASPLGITLLSSDMGKLYVALAQAIERLRR